MSKPAVIPFETTLQVHDACLCLHMQRAARVIAKHYDEAFRPLGLTSGQFSLMMSLNRPAPPTIGQVSALLAMDRTTLTANLKPLQRRGLVDVTAGAADKRSRLMMLTAAGRALLAAAVPLWERAQAEAEQLLADTGGARLRTDLRALAAG